MKSPGTLLLSGALCSFLLLPSCASPAGDVALGAVRTAAVIKAADDKNEEPPHQGRYGYKQQ